MQGAHDLGRTPSLVDAQVGHNVGGLEAAVFVAWDTCNSRYEGATENGTVPSIIKVLRGASTAIVPDKPLPN